MTQQDKDLIVALLEDRVRFCIDQAKTYIKTNAPIWAAERAHAERALAAAKLIKVSDVVPVNNEGRGDG
jgi:hypothetical protein